MTTTKQKAQRWKVSTPVERVGANGEVRTWWTELGTAWTNRDGSINVVLDGTPVNGKLHLRQDDGRKRNDDVSQEPSS